MRTEIRLTEKEQRNLDKIRRTRNFSGNSSWYFWGEICKIRGLDLSTLLTSFRYDSERDRDEISYTALPVGHNKEEWSWPFPLKCQKAPREVIREDEGLELALKRYFRNAGA